MTGQCPLCESSRVAKVGGELKPCPNLAVTGLGRLGCRKEDGSFYRNPSEVSNAVQQKDKAYRERNEVVSALAKAVIRLGGKAGRRKTSIPDWNPAWAWAIDIVLPNGLMWSWHYHTSHSDVFDWAPLASWEWNGTTTEQKYEQMKEWSP